MKSKILLVFLFSTMYIPCTLFAQKVYDDSLALTSLVRKVYQWYETQSTKEEFPPIVGKKQDSLYVGIDWKGYQLRQKELLKTSFFTQFFLQNHQKIANYIDKELSGGREWLMGDMSPIEPEANPWCNCQDSPDNYWKRLKIQRLKINNNVASFDWTWGKKFAYHVQAQKENNIWKISYLEGFDLKKYRALDGRK